ncbi:NADH dehydrogenase [ubiquinone] iron-sulfur protein 6 mitochondrial [Bienertia sinuspersici]
MIISEYEILCDHILLAIPSLKDKSKKSPMQLINEVPPIKVEGRIAVCEGAKNPLGHPVEFICLDLDTPAICKYCGLRYIQDHGHHH